MRRKRIPINSHLDLIKQSRHMYVRQRFLNSVRDKADLIASAVVAHIDGGSTEKGAVLNQEALQIMMLELVKQEVEKAMQNYFSKQENVQVEEETEEDVIEKQKISEFVLAPEVAKSVRDAMSAFRNR